MDSTRISLLGFFAVLLLSVSVAQAQPPGRGLPARIAALEAAVETLQTDLATANATINALQTRIAAIEGNTVLALDGLLFLDNTNGYATAQFRGVNVQVVNGTGATHIVNGLGNLIVGYNNPRDFGVAVCSDGKYDNETACVAAGRIWAQNHKTGSHNIVGGDQNSYSSYGGVVFGWYNAINRYYTAVTGGTLNVASGPTASISGGAQNTASGGSSNIGGGIQNTASGSHASISGGNGNTSSGFVSSVSGGWGNNASGYLTSVSGGAQNTASGDTASVSGGRQNTSSGAYASVSGGNNRSATSIYDWAAGSLWEDQ